MANRTESGAVSSDAYKRYGNAQGRFPIFDRRSALSALRLRGHAQTKKERENVLRRAAKFVPEQAKKAREVDRKAGKI